MVMHNFEFLVGTVVVKKSKGQCLCKVKFGNLAIGKENYHWCQLNFEGLGGLSKVIWTFPKVVWIQKGLKVLIYVHNKNESIP